MNQTALFKLSATVFAAFTLAGCTFTGKLWDKSVYTSAETVTTKENIHSFGFTKPDSKNLPANRLVMLTEKTAYVTDVTPEQDLVKALRTTELSKPFEVRGRHGLSVQLYDDNTFSAFSDINAGKSYICLGYRFEPGSNPALKKRETAILTKLGFKLGGTFGEQEQKLVYARCYDSIQGNAYTMSAPLPAEYRFKTPVPVEVLTTQGGGELMGTEVAKKVLLTPVTIIGDIIVMPLTLYLSPYGGSLF